MEFIEIDSLQSYLELIEEIQIEHESESSGTQIYFRGHADLNWNLEPSIFRNGYLEHESGIFNQSKLFTPKEFVNHDNTFEVLTKMQHYGYPTRLLDITSNPLVALYFAVMPASKVVKRRVIENDYEVEYSRKEDTDGEIFVVKDYTVLPDVYEVGINSNLSRISTISEIPIDEYIQLLKSDNIIVEDDIDSITNLQSVLSQVYVVNAGMKNQRIKLQSGAFILFGADKDYFVSDNVSRFVRKTKFNIDEKIRKNLGYRIIVTSENKESIRKSLELIGISESTLFPELENQASYIKKKYFVSDNEPVYENDIVIKSDDNTDNGVSSSDNGFEELAVVAEEVPLYTSEKITPNDLIKTYEENSSEGVLEFIMDFTKEVGIEGDYTVAANSIENILKNETTIDWESRESRISNIKRLIKRILRRNKLAINKEIEDKLENLIKEYESMIRGEDNV